MKQITINCASVESMAAMHDILTRELNFPQWYGRNLDALHDMLTGICKKTQITFLHFPALPFPSAGLLRVLQDSENENPNLEIALVTN